MQLAEARNIAVAICYKLEPYCSNIHIAGSIRRKKPEVKDIEICCLPKLQPVNNSDLFGGGKQMLEIMPGFVHTVTSLGTIEKGTPRGRYCKIILPQGINLDLFIPEPEDFYRQYVIRTGSADYAFKVIATGWRRKGWVGSDLGLRQEKDCIETKLPGGKSKWTCVRNKDAKPPVWTSEEDFFDWLNIKYLKPEYRNI
jgi:DNA polymerase/3'-5' exonuclease PolX